jgi:signal peptidase II
MNRWSLFGIVVAVGVVLDQVSKLAIDRSMQLHQSFPVIDGIMNVTYVRNRGAAFSFLSEASWRLPFFVVVTLIACAVIVVALRRMAAEQTLGQLAVSMVFAGALGNLIDRIRVGEVVDFIDVYWRQYHWPAFNVADMFICVGVALVLLDMIRTPQEPAGEHS